MKQTENILNIRFWFGDIDTRWLAVFRILLGLLILKDALYHLPLARIFYSDAGIIPRRELFNGLVRDPRFTMMDALGQPWMVTLFFITWVIVLILLIIGYRVRLMTVLNFLLILSVHERNGYILTGADTLMRAMSFWLMFAPVGQHYAVDVFRRRLQAFHKDDTAHMTGQQQSSPRHAFALPVRMIQLQLIMIYFSTAYLKTIDDIWLSGDTLHYIVQIDTFILPVGVWMRSWSPELLRIMSLSVLYIEFLIPLLLLSPLVWRWTRAIAFFLALALHGGIAVSLSIQDFSILMLICYLPFFAPEWMDWLQNHISQRGTPLKLAPPSTRWHPLAILISMTASNNIQITTTSQPANSADDWKIDTDETCYQGVQAWQHLAALMPFSRLWSWVLRFSSVRQLLWQIFTKIADHYYRKPVDHRQHLWHISTPSLKQLLSLILIPMLILVMIWNTEKSLQQHDANFTFPRPLQTIYDNTRNIVWYTGLWQFWDLFAPIPIQYDGWLVVEGHFENGYSYDLFTDAPVDYNKPTRWWWGPQMKWEKFEENIYLGQYPALLRGWGSYYCNTLNENRVEGTRLATLTITMVVRDFHHPGEQPNTPRTEILWNHWCYEEYAPD